MKSTKRTLLLAMLVAFAAAVLVGCDEGPQSPSKATVDAGNKDRLDAIDKDPKMSPANKERMKAVLSNRQPPKSR